jgi:hypothetical protein
VPDFTAKARGLGPFTGRQLTIIFCVVVVMVMLPAGAFAIAGTNSFITDHSTGKQAQVTAAGQLKAAVAAPRDLRIPGPNGATGACTTIGTVVGGTQAFIVLDLNISYKGMTPGDSELLIYADKTCGDDFAEVQVPTASGTLSLPLGAGVKINAGQALTAKAFGSNPTGWVIAAPGYLAPSSS